MRAQFESIRGSTYILSTRRVVFLVWHQSCQNILREIVSQQLSKEYSFISNFHRLQSLFSCGCLLCCHSSASSFPCHLAGDVCCTAWYISSSLCLVQYKQQCIIVSLPSSRGRLSANSASTSQEHVVSHDKE
jgi:hypothetical protein